MGFQIAVFANPWVVDKRNLVLLVQSQTCRTQCQSINDAAAATSANNPQAYAQGFGNSSQILTLTLFPQLAIEIRF